VTDETAIYTCTGTPHPNDIAEIMESCMKESFEAAYRRACAVA
jgi:replication factor C subunit 3/5